MNWLGMAFRKNKKIRRLILLSAVVLISLIAANVLFTYYSAVSTTRITVASHGVEMAKSIAASIDRQTYSEFLANPTYTDTYWDLRTYLNDARQKIGALHVYTLKIDNREVSLGMIMGMPREAAGYEIGTICTVPPKQVSLAFDGKTFVTDTLDDPDYGHYVTVGAPILDGNLNAIGYIGIDLSVEMLNEIKTSVTRKAFPRLFTASCSSLF